MSPTKHTPQPARLIPIKRGAERIGLPYTSVRDMCFKGELHVFRSGRRWYLDQRELDQWVEGRLEKLA